LTFLRVEIASFHSGKDLFGPLRHWSLWL